MAAVVAKVGVRRAQRLWVHLLAVEEASPEDLAWLALLACWCLPCPAAALLLLLLLPIAQRHALRRTHSSVGGHASRPAPASVTSV